MPWRRSRACSAKSVLIPCPARPTSHQHTRTRATEGGQRVVCAGRGDVQEDARPRAFFYLDQHGHPRIDILELGAMEGGRRAVYASHGVEKVGIWPGKSIHIPWRHRPFLDRKIQYGAFGIGSAICSFPIPWIRLKVAEKGNNFHLRSYRIKLTSIMIKSQMKKGSNMHSLYP